MYRAQGVRRGWADCNRTHRAPGHRSAPSRSRCTQFSVSAAPHERTIPQVRALTQPNSATQAACGSGASSAHANSQHLPHTWRHQLANWHTLEGGGGGRRRPVLCIMIASTVKIRRCLVPLAAAPRLACQPQGFGRPKQIPPPPDRCALCPLGWIGCNRDAPVVGSNHCAAGRVSACPVVQDLGWLQ